MRQLVDQDQLRMAGQRGVDIEFLEWRTISMEDRMNNVAEVHVQKPASPLSVRNFRLLWIGEGISLLGDQFYMIALPWLVLSLTGNALAVGTVMAIAGIPRALFMLVGGALTDRFTPRKLMINSNLARMVLTGLLAVLVATNL